MVASNCRAVTVSIPAANNNTLDLFKQGLASQAPKSGKRNAFVRVFLLRARKRYQIDGLACTSHLACLIIGKSTDQWRPWLLLPCARRLGTQTNTLWWLRSHCVGRHCCGVVRTRDCRLGPQANAFTRLRSHCCSCFKSHELTIRTQSLNAQLEKHSPIHSYIHNCCTCCRDS